MVESRAAIGGHPLHPMLIPLPIGLLVGALLGNIVFTVSDNLAWYDVAFWAGWAGVVSGVAAALLGLVDYATLVKKRERRTATMHLGLNAGALVLFAAAGLMSTDRGASAGGSSPGCSRCRSPASPCSPSAAGWAASSSTASGSRFRGAPSSNDRPRPNQAPSPAPRTVGRPGCTRRTSCV